MRAVCVKVPVNSEVLSTYLKIKKQVNFSKKMRMHLEECHFLCIAFI